MKMQHKYNHGWWPGQSTQNQPDPAYDREIAETLRKAEKRWRAAQKRLAFAERIAEHRPEPQTLQQVRELRTEVLARLAELREVEHLMRRPAPAGSRPVRIVNKRGSDL